MKHQILVSLCMAVTMSYAQPNKKFTNYLNENFQSLSLQYIIFFEPELVSYCQDSVHRVEFSKEISRQRRKLLKDDEASLERKVFLHLFFNRVSKINVKSKSEIESKNFIVNQLKPFEVLDFVIDEKLIQLRLDPKKRGMPFGDEECDYDYSLFTFYLYNPELYLKVIKESKVVNSAGKIIFPTKCFLEELSYLPLEMKKKVQNEMLKMIENYKGKNFEELRKIIQNADLNAHYH